jgi:23S rRNA (uridine2552-2'-O)-methyltransferase
MHLDSWAKKAKSNGYRSRAVFKLEEILGKIKFKNTDGKVLDIGSSPGGWSQYIIKNFPKKEVYAIDVLAMKSIDGVCFVKEDIHNIDEIELLHKNKGSFELVISDIAPNLTGVNAVDIENVYELNILTISIANRYLQNSSGFFIMKTFQNSMLKILRKNMAIYFDMVQTYKPAASKKQSGEIYLYGVK